MRRSFGQSRTASGSFDELGRSGATRGWSLPKSLRKMGLEKGDRVMLVSENRPEWCIADLGIMAAGCVTVPTYITNTERDHQHIIDK